MPTILIADEAGLFVALETTPILRAGCNLVSVRSPGELLARASTLSPDLFLLDADLLGPSTRDCIRSIKADRKLSKVPIVIAARDPGPLEGVLTNLDRIFAKPVPPDELGGTLKTVLPLARRRSRRVALSAAVTCTVAPDRTVRARCKDVAAGGIFIKTPWDPPCGTRFLATFSLPAGSISATCEVVRLVGETELDMIPGVGATIVRISEPDAGLLREFVGAAA
jgi:CheY-like chemotaxis protein